MKNFSRTMLTALVLVTSASVLSQNNSRFVESLKILQGDWVAEGGGEPGQGSGIFSFHFDLDNKVMIRKSESKYPASGNKPAIVHEDLMVIYEADAADSLKAIYFDNEGHKISYSVSFSGNGQRIEFLSKLSPGTTGFRLTYELTGSENMSVVFDISPDGIADHFRTYVKGISHRKK